MQRFGKWIAVISLVAAVGAAQAQNVTGAWNGKVLVDTSKFPKQPDAAKQKQFEQMVAAQVKTIKVTLNMNANKTFAMKITGLPAMGAPAGGKAGEQTAEGTWIQKGTLITVKITKANGAAPKGANEPQTIKILDGGKRMELAAAKMPGSKIIFVR